MQASQRTWRGLVTAPPQSGQVHKGSALVLIGFCNVVDDVAAAWAEALRAFSTAVGTSTVTTSTGLPIDPGLSLAVSAPIEWWGNSITAQLSRRGSP